MFEEESAQFQRIEIARLDPRFDAESGSGPGRLTESDAAGGRSDRTEGGPVRGDAPPRDQQPVDPFGNQAAVGNLVKIPFRRMVCVAGTRFAAESTVRIVPA